MPQHLNYTPANPYNLISNPFDKSILWSEVKSANPNITQDIRYFESGNYSVPEYFEPYKGYYFVNSTGLSSLIIPYPTGNTLPKKEIPTSCELELVLVKSGIERTGIIVGFSEESKSGVDNLDIFSPPANFCEIFIAIKNTNLESHIKILEKEYRPEIGEGQEYSLMIKNTSEEVLYLKAKGLENFNNYEIYLLDNSLMQMYNLRDQSNIKVKTNIPEKEYTLYIGTEEYILNKKSDLLPTEYKLYQNYPNPFNPTTTIRFAIPENDNVELNVYNVLGELVSQLIKNKEYEAGYHEVEFYAERLSSGIYIYRLQTSSFVETKKMLLLR